MAGCSRRSRRDFPDVVGWAGRKGRFSRGGGGGGGRPRRGRSPGGGGKCIGGSPSRPRESIMGGVFPPLLSPRGGAKNPRRRGQRPPPATSPTPARARSP